MTGLDHVPQLTFQVDDPGATDIVPLIEQLDGYLARLYPTSQEPPGAGRALHKPEVTFLSARVDGTPVACGAFFDRGDYVELAQMYVIPTCRGLGLGKQLLEALEKEIRRTGARLIRLETGIAQTEALEMYERTGYRRCAHFGYHRPNPLSIFMEKPLT
jgi:putative acetyltransferase